MLAELNSLFALEGERLFGGALEGELESTVVVDGEVLPSNSRLESPDEGLPVTDDTRFESPVGDTVFDIELVG